MSSLVGQSLGRYQIVEQLGEGGMAAVYKAFDTRLERFVALKVILPNFQISNQFLKRFEREAKALAQLSHPNIVKVHDYGEHVAAGGDAVPYLVMEYLPGGTLKASAGQTISPAEAARLLLPLARALGHAHRQGIVHRDVKPANVLITESGEPMLSDFGIARMLEGDQTQGLTGTGMGIGTPEYMAPEQGMGEKVDARADIYALGVMLYEMVTGRKPYRADTPMAVMLKKASEPLPPPTRYIPSLPPAVEGVILKALARQPEQRYASMDQFAAALENIMRGGHVEATLVTGARDRPTPPPTAPVKKRRAGLSLPLTIAAVVLVLALGAGVLYGVGQLFGEKETPPAATDAPAVEPTTAQTAALEDEEPTTAPQPTPLPTSDLTFAYPAEAITGANAASLSELARWGKGAALTVEYSQDGSLLAVGAPLGIYLYDAASFTQVGYIEEAGYAAALAFAPDGETVVVCQDGIVRFWSLADGGLYRSLDFEVNSEIFALSPDSEASPQGSGGGGQYLASDGKDDDLQVRRASDGELLHTLTGHSGNPNMLVFSPDSRLLVSVSDDETVRMWDPASGTLLRTLEGHESRVQLADFSPDGALLATGGANSGVILWNAATGEQVRKVGTDATPLALAFSPDRAAPPEQSGGGGSTLAVARGSGVEIWQISDGALLRTLETDGRVRSLAFSMDGKRIALTTEQYRLQVWDVAASQLLYTDEAHSAAYTAVDFSQDGSRLGAALGRTIGSLATGTNSEEAVQVWDVDTAVIERIVPIPIGNANGFIFAADNTLLVAGSGSTTSSQVLMWRERDGATLTSQGGHAGSIYGVALSSDETLAASGDINGEVRLWSTVDGALLNTWQESANEKALGHLAFSPSGQMLATGGYDHIVRLWQVPGGELLHEFPEHTSPIEELVFSQNGALMAVGRSYDASLWRADSGKEINLLDAEGEPYRLANAVSVAFSPDGSLLAAGGDALLVWDTATGALLFELEIGVLNTINDLAFSADGALLAGGLRDGTVRIWGMAP